MLGSGRDLPGFEPHPASVLRCDLCQLSEALSASVSSLAKWGGKHPCNPHRDGQIKPSSGRLGKCEQVNKAGRGCAVVTANYPCSLGG